MSEEPEVSSQRNTPTAPKLVYLKKRHKSDGHSIPDGVPVFSGHEVRRVKLVYDGAPMPIHEAPRLADSDQAGEFCANQIGLEATENFLAVWLSKDGHVLGTSILGQGMLDQVSMDNRSLCRTAIMMDARMCILSHNHPNGFALPSKGDLDGIMPCHVALSAIGVDMLDHIIVSGSEWYSLRSWMNEQEASKTVKDSTLRKKRKKKPALTPEEIAAIAKMSPKEALAMLEAGKKTPGQHSSASMDISWVFDELEEVK